MTQNDQVQSEGSTLRVRRTLVGEVVSNKMMKTIVVRVSRRISHRFYKKYVAHLTRYQVHDEKNEARVGDRVKIVESRPLSRKKRWALQSIMRRADQSPELNI